MSFSEKAAGFRKLQQEHPAWSLLRADHAPLILAFLAELFADERDVEVPVARSTLNEYLREWREQFGAQAETDASLYLRQWQDAGYVRESDQHLSLTDAASTAIRFAGGLRHRELGATASHLRVVQDAVRDLYLGITGNVEERRRLLLAQKLEAEYQLEQLSRGVVHKLPTHEQRERISEVAILARQLAGDFRHIEDEIRRIDQDLRRQMVELAGERGEVVGNLLDQEDLLSRSAAGQAFESFFEMLSDVNREVEFREQLKVIAAEGVSGSDADRKLLSRLVRDLTQESRRVFKRRQRTWESLRAFVTHRANSDEHAIEELLAELLRIGVTLKDVPGVTMKTSIDAALGTGRVRVSSPHAVTLRQPNEEIGELEIVQHETSGELSRGELDRLRTVRTRAVAARMIERLRDTGPLTLGELAALNPITEGLEEVVAQIRIAHFVGAFAFGGEQVIEFTERDGRIGRARIPTLQLDAAQFPVELSGVPL